MYISQPLQLVFKSSSSSVQYNNKLIFNLHNFSLKHANPRSARLHIHASVAQMQWYCRAIVCEELAQGPYTVTVLNPCSSCYRLRALTNRPLCHTMVVDVLVQKETHLSHIPINADQTLLFLQQSYKINLSYSHQNRLSIAYNVHERP